MTEKNRLVALWAISFSFVYRDLFMTGIGCC